MHRFKRGHKHADAPMCMCASFCGCLQAVMGCARMWHLEAKLKVAEQPWNLACLPYGAKLASSGLTFTGGYKQL